MIIISPTSIFVPNTRHMDSSVPSIVFSLFKKLCCTSASFLSQDSSPTLHASHLSSMSKTGGASQTCQACFRWDFPYVSKCLWRTPPFAGQFLSFPLIVWPSQCLPVQRPPSFLEIYSLFQSVLKHRDEEHFLPPRHSGRCTNGLCLLGSTSSFK